MEIEERVNKLEANLASLENCHEHMVVQRLNRLEKELKDFYPAANLVIERAKDESGLLQKKNVVRRLERLEREFVADFEREKKNIRSYVKRKVSNKELVVPRHSHVGAATFYDKPEDFDAILESVFKTAK